jgi:hypothetical protein
LKKHDPDNVATVPITAPGTNGYGLFLKKIEKEAVAGKSAQKLFIRKNCVTFGEEIRY